MKAMETAAAVEKQTLRAFPQLRAKPAFCAGFAQFPQPLLGSFLQDAKSGKYPIDVKHDL